MAATPVRRTKNDKDAKRDKVIDVLNKARGMELYAIFQYMNQHYVLDDADYGALAGKIKRIAIDEMRHAEKLAERIKNLGGKPATVPEGAVQKEQDVRKMYPFDADVETDTMEKYNQFIQLCRECGDNTSQRLFEKLLAEEQAHYDYFDNEATHIKQLGDCYLARMAGTTSEAD